MNHGHKKKSYFFIHFIVYLIIILYMYILFAVNGKSFLWNADGPAQHFPTLCYLGEYYRNILKCIMELKFGDIPKVDFRIGQGMDILATLNYYGLGDPLNLLSVFFNPDRMEILYDFLIFLRFYLSGVAFSCYCFVRKQKNTSAILLGSISYSFCGMALFSGVRHPFFLNGMIYLPLLLIGVERILKNRKYTFFIVMCAISLVSNFYFAYINTILMGIYILFRLHAVNIIKIKDKLAIIGKMIGSYMVGVGLSAFVFFPILYAYSINARGGSISGYHDSIWYYQIEYYRNLFIQYIGPKLGVGSWSVLVLTPISLVSALFLLLKHNTTREAKKRNRLLKLGMLLLLLMMCVPLFGKIFNGFGYVCNRWTYAFALLNAWIVVVVAPDLLRCSKKEKVKLAISCVLYIILSIISCNLATTWGRDSGKDNITLLNMTSIYLLVVMIILFVHKKGKGKLVRRKGILLNVTTVLILGVNIFMVFSPDMGGYLNEFIWYGGGISYINNSPVQSVKTIEDDEFYRVEQNAMVSNQGSVLGYNGNTFYYSLVPKYIMEYYDDVALNTLPTAYKCNGQDSRTALNALSATKYYVTRSNQIGAIPYGYELLKKAAREDGTIDHIYRNKYALPLGYTYSSYIRKSEFEKLSSTQRQEVMLQSVVIEDKEDMSNTKIEEHDSKTVQLVSRSISYQIEDLDGVMIKNGVIDVQKNNASLKLTFDGEKNAETYLVMNGLKIESGSSVNHFTIHTGKNPNKAIVVHGEDNNAYYNKKENSANLGYSVKKRCSCKISFPKKGVFSYDSMEVWSYSMKEYKDQIAALREDSLSDINMENNLITGEITVSKPKWLQFSIPYSEGWSVYIDGEKKELLESDTMYMGVEVMPGKHTVVLKYQTPWLAIGVVVSIVSLLGIVIYSIVNGSRRGRYEEE